MSKENHHGVDTLEIERGTRPVKTVESSVIGLVGIAPTGPVNTLTLCTSEKDAAQFGNELGGFSLPQALRAIYDHGVGTVMVVNVFDPDTHQKNVQGNLTFNKTRQSITLKQLPAGDIVVKSADGQTTFREVTDYTLEKQTGKVTRVATGGIAEEVTVSVTYRTSDVSKVTASDILGTVNAADQRTGMKALENADSLFGFRPKLLIAPGFSHQNAVASAMIALAHQCEAIAYIDAPAGTTFAQAIAGRGPQGTINFNTASDRVRLCYPQVKVYDKATNQNRLEPLSAHAAGLRAKVDREKGFWWSSSNQELMGIVGIERPLSARIDDANSEVNLLNQNGITTVFNSFGSGLRLWGNRTAAWPTVTHLKNFENVRRTGDMINESIRHFSLQYIDRPINQGLIDALTESVNGYGRRLIADGALLGFHCWYDPANNTKDGLSLGQLKLNYKYTPPPPMEHLTFETEITDEYLTILKSKVSS
ncbi:phage tail protein [Arsenophonus sp. ENCA]|uniref:phage tail sheath subtilisin-like domain-containing protein n=1 Tax=Arsenophonus sp. ENCA TaxID=1987579 RepID=UPI000BC8546B|nr:phage tail sheath subtilisin-like domain-containing protein [Arsenophonus sp. ENCA]PAV02758.1 phage tail protein [Arsenophonus sp. ENCA]